MELRRNRMRLLFVSLFCAGVFAGGCAEKSLDKDEYSYGSIKYREGACADVAFEETRLKMREADGLKGLNQTQQAEAMYDEAFRAYLRNELDYMKLQGMISNARVELAQQRRELDAVGDFVGRRDAESFLKSAEVMINICEPLKAADFINKSRDLLK